MKFRVGQIVWLAFSRDETVMGFAFPKEERDWLIGGSPDKFMLPGPSDLRYYWVLARLAALDEAEMRDLVLGMDTSPPWALPRPRCGGPIPELALAKIADEVDLPTNGKTEMPSSSGVRIAPSGMRA